MARASTVTKLPLDRFFFNLGMHPLHANQVYLDTAELCPDPLKQFAWQNHAATSREDIAREVRQAEEDIERWLGFPLAPTWYTEEVHQLDWPPMWSPRRMPRPDFRLDHGQLISGGTRRSTLVEAGVTITYTDADGDGYDEVATVTTAVAVDPTTDPCEVHAYFPGWDGAEEYEIRPLASTDVSAGGLITITFRREQAVLLTLTDDPIIPEPIDGTVDANFLGEVDIYLVDNDPSQQLILEWAPADYYCGLCSGTGCSACLTYTQTACLVAKDKRLGLATYVPATWNTGTEVWDVASHDGFLHNSANRVRAFYRAGWQYRNARCPSLTMDPKWERLVTILAVSRLDRRFCSCDTLEAQAQKWRKDYIAMEEGQFTNTAVAQRVIDNPLGTTVGAVAVWNTIRSMLTTGAGEVVRP